ncbi:expressed unknown protein [Ectocarpus siliculosus]|uniref:Uncharacterized protein n=1 Tax=Ectocarpus siliculosus TaxID=2880 RepID=D7FUX2_ECTSI|nr:expressed unknown protein [Ectocarpus siliculosus]|eukprot:CBJ31778.1 expressed unknown protein [Ectocarpus siliculosus]
MRRASASGQRHGLDRLCSERRLLHAQACRCLLSPTNPVGRRGVFMVERPDQRGHLPKSGERATSRHVLRWTARRSSKGCSW